MKKVTQVKNKSLKTFYLYAILVLIVILSSLVIKSIFIFEQSKFDPSHQFTLAIIQGKDIKEVISFHPQTPSLSILSIDDSDIPYEGLAKKYGIETDGYIKGDTPMPLSEDTTAFLWTSLLPTTNWQSNLTVIDKIRLFLLAKNVTTNNKTIEEISLKKQTAETNTLIANALTDQELSAENISIQVINATEISGLGQRLGRALTNMGANVVDVSTAQQQQADSTIAYYSNESYTLSRVEKLLNIIPNRLTRQQIADIVITIGNDRRNTSSF